MSSITDDLISFITASPTAWHAVQSVAKKLSTHGFTPLDETTSWSLKKGGRYFVCRNGSICAFSLPKAAPSSLTILGAHTDSPALKLKPNPNLHHAPFAQLATESYGAPLLSSWLNRDLAIAGRILTKNNRGTLQEQLVFLDSSPLFIPQLPIHLDREVNEKGLLLDKQDHLNPILSLNPSDTLEPLLKKHISFKELLSFDLFLVPLEPPRLLGPKHDILASYRLDNLSSAHAIITAFTSVSPSSLSLMFLWDAEEIGSRTAEGAASTFTADILSRLQHFYNYNNDSWLALKASSLCISVDVAHAYNPSHPKKFDPNHHPLPGHGTVIKYHADKKYATDARTAARIIAACHHLKIPYQSFTSRSDTPSGSTIGPIFAAQLGIPTVDIGSPLLSMHSIREAISLHDHALLCQLLKYFVAS